MLHKTNALDRVGKIIVDSLLLALLWLILALPATSISILGYNSEPGMQVLSGQDTRQDPTFNYETGTQSYRELLPRDETLPDTNQLNY